MQTGGACSPARSLLAASASAQNSPDEQARGLLEDGRAYWAQGKLKQALDNFNTIVTGFPNTDSVDDALLEIGRYHMEVEGNLDKAREAFDQVAKRFPQSDGAPGAYYYLGWLTLTRASSTGRARRRPGPVRPAAAALPAQRLGARRRSTRRASRTARRAGFPRPWRRSGGSPSSTRTATRRPPPSSRSATCLALIGEPRAGHGGVPAGPQPLPRERMGRRGPGPDHRASIASTASGKPGFTPDAASSRGRGRRPEGRAGDPDDAGAHALDRLGQGEERRSLRARRQDGTGPRRRGPAEPLPRAPRRRRGRGPPGGARGPRDVKSFAIPGDKPGVLGAAGARSRPPS